MREGCRFPGNAPSTAYGKGCRCEGCRLEEASAARRCRRANPERVRERDRRYREANREKLAEKSRRYREASPETVAEGDRRYRAENLGSRRRQSAAVYKAYVAATPPIVTGPYLPAEDAVIQSWEGRVVDLAVALGRTFYSVRDRRLRLTIATHG